MNNYSIHRRLSDLKNPPANVDYGKKTDIFEFALFILSLLKGAPVSGDNVDMGDSVSPEFSDLLSKCLHKDERERCTASQLLNHSIFRLQSIPQSPARKNENMNIDRNNSPEIAQTDFVISFQSQLSNGQSRINNEFEFLKHLGKGAFGDVIKVCFKIQLFYFYF